MKAIGNILIKKIEFEAPMTTLENQFRGLAYRETQFILKTPTQLFC